MPNTINLARVASALSIFIQEVGSTGRSDWAFGGGVDVLAVEILLCAAIYLFR